MLDAVVGMEGNGPSQGRAKELGLIIASHDAVAADYLACRLMGLDPGAVATVTLAHQAGLGAAGPAEIELAGAQWDRLPGVRFALPMSFKFRSAQRLLPPKITGRLMARLLEAKPRTVPDNCRACGLCVESCPAGALSLQGGPSAWTGSFAWSAIAAWNTARTRGCACPGACGTGCGPAVD